MTETPTVAEHGLTPVRGLVLLRHGATEWSKSGQHTGRTDLPLLPEGLDEARAAAGNLASMPIVAAYASPLRRARDTAELLGIGVPIELREDLLEWDYGEYEGVTTSEIRDRDPDWDLFRDGCPGGERPDEVVGRAQGFLDSLSIDPAADGLALVVAHGHILRVLSTTYLDVGVGFGRQLELGSAHLCVLGHERDARSIEAWNLPPQRA